MTNVMVKACLDPKNIKNSKLIQAFKNSVCPKAKVIRWPNFSESRICPNIYRILMFRSVDWTHDMIIVKWHLFIWHERKLCVLTNAPPVQSAQMVNDYQRYSMVTVLPLRFMSCTLAIHICSKLQGTTILAGITIHWASRRIISKIFCVANDDKCNGENMN